MRLLLIVGTLSVLALPLPAQSPVGFTAWAGAGPSFGGVGVQGEILPRPLPFGVIGAVGYGPPGEFGSAAQLTGALGVRTHLRLGPVPMFFELAYGPLVRDVVTASRAASEFRSSTLYGVGLQTGLALRSCSGLALLGGGGVGYATSTGVVASRWKVVGTLGIGYSFGAGPCPTGSARR